MAKLRILLFPDKRLKTVATPVKTIDETILQHLDDMLETMRLANGVGLASTQVGIPWRLVVIDSEDGNNPLFLINPEILHLAEPTESEEGCLSFPGVYVKVKRFNQAQVQYLDRHGTPQVLSAEGLLSICLQHEIEHLDGITHYDHLSPMKQSFVRSKMNKYLRTSL